MQYDVCSEKVVYKSEEDANKAAAGINSREKRKVHSYKCKTCHLWHITTRGKIKGKRNFNKKSHTTEMHLDSTDPSFNPSVKTFRKALKGKYNYT